MRKVTARSKIVILLLHRGGENGIMLHMNEAKPDFSTSAHLFPRINREGMRFGLIRFGSRLDVYLPAGVEPEVRVGQVMVAGETILGHIQ